MNSSIQLQLALFPLGSFHISSNLFNFHKLQDFNLTFLGVSLTLQFLFVIILKFILVDVL